MQFQMPKSTCSNAEEMRQMIIMEQTIACVRAHDIQFNSINRNNRECTTTKLKKEKKERTK